MALRIHNKLLRLLSLRARIKMISLSPQRSAGRGASEKISTSSPRPSPPLHGGEGVSALALMCALSFLFVAFPARAQQSADDFFHGGAMFYLSNNIPSAKEVVTNGMQRFPDDEKLKKLWELLNQQQQSQSQQQQPQQQNEQKQDGKKQEEKKQEQEEKQQQEQKSQESKGDEKKEQKEMQAHAMTPEEAKQLLDAQKGEEQVLQFRPQEPKNRGKVLKDW
jgi:hypothetical protein